MEYESVTQEIAALWVQEFVGGASLDDLAGSYEMGEILASLLRSPAEDVAAGLNNFLYGVRVPSAVQQRVRGVFRLMVASIIRQGLEQKVQEGSFPTEKLDLFLQDLEQDQKDAATSFSDLCAILAGDSLNSAQTQFLEETKAQAGATRHLLAKLRREAEER